ncbi:DUF262 domain-containing protein [Clostridioides difficile]
MIDNLKKKLENLQKIAKERTVKTQNIEYDLETLVKKIDKNIIKLDPEYQRNHRWSNETSSRLVESLILNIPIPTVYISQDIDVDEEVEYEIARYSVIDGQQRLTAIHSFMKNKYKLEGMNVLEELNGFCYSELPAFLIRRLEERTLKCLRIDSTLDPQVKYDIFERLNTGAVQLESQELRNAIYRGKFNDLIKELAQNNNFRKLIGVKLDNAEESSKVKKMQDIELVLRFFALDEGNYNNVKKGFKNFLSEEMEKFNKLDKIELEILKKKFISVIDYIIKNFGDNAFAKYKINSDKSKPMSKFNAAVYDALMIGVSSNINTLLGRNFNSDLKDSYIQLFDDIDFFSAVEGSVNDREKIIARIEKVKGILS